MTIRTAIPYRNGDQFADHTGPLLCDRCKRSLIDRSPDAKEDSVDRATNAELVLYVWESEVDAQGHPICGTCAEDEEQAAAYLELAKWRGRAENRGYYCDRSGVTVYEGQERGPTFELVLGKISSHKVFTFTGRDPLKIQPGLRYLREQKAIEAIQLPSRHADLLPHTWNDADELELNEDCPETERNCER